MKHTHGALSEPASDHVLQPSNRGQLGALTRLLKLDLAGKQSPEDLGDQLVVRVCLRRQNLLKQEEVLVRI